MCELSDDMKKRLWQEVREEFPDDEMMQEVHFVRLLHYHQTKGLSREQRLRFFNAPSESTRL